ncbi:MAG: Clp protease N-terminal domain-containing protein [Gaiellaceae bacterium]
MFQRFTERARSVVVHAQDEARQLKHNYIGTEHLLLGLLREDAGGASRVLASLDVTLPEVRAEVVETVGVGDSAGAGAVPFTPRAKRVLELSAQEARLLGHEYIATEHVLLGIAVEGTGVAARILAEVSDVDDVCAEIVRRLGGIPRRTPPRTRRWRVWR